MDLKKLTDKAKDLVEQRGGTESVKEDAEELKDIAKGSGSLTDKAKAAVEAIKDPGDDDTAPAAASAPTAAEAAPPEAEDAERGKHGQGQGRHRGGGGRGQGQGRHGGGGGRHGGRDGDPAV